MNTERQNRHIEGGEGYVEGRSILTADPVELLRLYAGRGELVFSSGGEWTRKEHFTHGTIIGIWKSGDGTRSAPTPHGIIHHSKNGAHIVPARPEREVF